MKAIGPPHANLKRSSITHSIRNCYVRIAESASLDRRPNEPLFCLMARSWKAYVFMKPAANSFTDVCERVLQPLW